MFLSRFRIFDFHQTDGGKFRLAMVVYLDGHHVVLPVRHRKCILKVSFVDEVRNQERRATLLDRIGQVFQYLANIRLAVFRLEIDQLTNHIQDVLLSLLRRNEFLHFVGKENHADLIIILDRRKGQRGCNFGDDILLSGVSLVGAVSHGGLQFVRLFYYSRSENVDSVQKRLDEVTKSIRYELAAKMKQKYVPDIRFEYDDTLERAERIDKIINNLELE